MNDTGSGSGEQFSEKTRVGEALERHPRARRVFASYTTGDCADCAISTEETVADVARTYGVRAEEIVSALNALLQEADN